MENEYKFVSKFIEGKTYKELTPEELEKLKSGVGVKKEDKEYFDSLNNDSDNIKDNINEQDNISNESVKEENKSSNENIEKNDEKIVFEKSKKGVKIIQAFGRTLKLEDGRKVELTEKQLKEKAFWCKGEMYYG